MNTDIRISVHFYDNPKTVKLERKLGLPGIKSLQQLWMWTAIERPDGDLSGLDNESVEIAARWHGEPTALVTVLTELGWLDGTESNYQIHDWAANNPWAADAIARSDAARLSRLYRNNPEKAKELKEQGRTGITAEEYREYVKSTTVVRSNNARSTLRTTPAPAPSPSPSPSPDPAPSPVPSPIPEERSSPTCIENSKQGGSYTHLSDSADAKSDARDTPPSGSRQTMVYPAEFEQAWKDYPHRHIGDDKAAAFKQWQRRRLEGYSAVQMQEGIRRYAAYIRAMDQWGTRYVQMAKTFLGNHHGDLQFLKDWAILVPHGKHNGQRFAAQYSAEDYEQAKQNILARFRERELALAEDGNATP